MDIDNVLLSPSSYECVNDADAMILATDWNEYRQGDFGVIRKLTRGDLIVDTRNIYDPPSCQKVVYATWVLAGKFTQSAADGRRPLLSDILGS